MGNYRQTRNIEASVVDFLKDCFEDDWSGVSVEKSFARIYKISLPSICVRVGTTTHIAIEIGSEATQRVPQLLIDVFGQNDGNKLDLIDYIISKIKNGFPYYEYEITGGVVSEKTSSGRIRVIKPIEVTNINFDEDKDRLDEHDKYRSLISCSLSLGKVEN